MYGSYPETILSIEHAMCIIGVRARRGVVVFTFIGHLPIPLWAQPDHGERKSLNISRVHIKVALELERAQFEGP